MSQAQLTFGPRDLIYWTMIVIKNVQTVIMQTKTIIARHAIGNVAHALITTLVLLVLKQVITSTSTKTSAMRTVLQAHIKTEMTIARLVTHHVVSAQAQKMGNALHAFKYLAMTLSF